MNKAIIAFDLPWLGVPTIGKVRTSYRLGENRRLIITSDRISAFDVVMANGIPDKGRVLNLMSAWWFDELDGTCPNHLVSVEDQDIAEATGVSGAELQRLLGRSMICREATPLKIECVVRGFITGSGLKDYRRTGEICGIKLPEGLQEAACLPEPIFTPATKAEEGHDENITFDQAADIVGWETAEQVRSWSIQLYTEAAMMAASQGLILADTKFEFGETPDGLILIDEALTPDSSRYWEMETYLAGQPQPSFDKQFVRDYLERSGFNKQPPGPTLPEDIVSQTHAKYLEAFRRVTGNELPALVAA